METEEGAVRGATGERAARAEPEPRPVAAEEMAELEITRGPEEMAETEAMGGALMESS